MSARLSLLAVAGISAVAACACSPSYDEPDPGPYTVSYRNPVRLPGSGVELTAEAFAAQVRSKDPIAAVRCTPEESPAYRDLTAFLGGVAWSHPMSIIKDSAYPPLYFGPRPPTPPMSSSAAGAAEAAARAPTIERPDLVGIKNGVAIFLSSQHGLVAVDTRNPDLKPSCAVKVPGDAKNFLFRGNELVAIVNGRDGRNHSALVRYAFDGGKLRFVDAVRLDHQIIEDARLFDATIVAYTSWNRPAATDDAVIAPYEASPYGAAIGGYPGGSASGAMARPDGDSVASANRLGAKVIVVQWDEALGVDWEDSLLSDPPKTDPMEGLPADGKYTAGQVVNETKSYLSFVSASDRYVAVPRSVTRTKFVRYETYTYQVCTSYNPQYEQVEQCSVKYEQRPNPDYRAPNPATGDYQCNGKPLEQCVQDAAPTVSQYIQVPVGRECTMVWRGRCEKYETRSTTYPRFETDRVTELTIYRFEGGSFTRLDASLGKMTQKSDALVFETGPLAVPGTISNRNQVQFQRGRLYVVADGALQTLAVAGNSVSYLNRLAIGDQSSTQSPAIAFSSDRAMISALNSSNRSTVTMLDLSSPSLPKAINSFQMPGQSTQLILAPGGILGPGQVSFTSGNVRRNLEKLTLFSRTGGQELDNLLLGTEYDVFETSWFNTTDDQRIRLDGSGQRLFLPYSGRHHADSLDPTAHRLNISRIEGDRLVSERSFNVNDDVIRTASIDDDRALVFGNSAIYVTDKKTGTWEISTLRETYVPFASYRLDDGDMHARIARVGSKCKITTHAGGAQVFGPALAEAIISCPEDFYGPTGYKRNLFFATTGTGVRISDDGRAIDALTKDEVAGLVASAKAASQRYCYIMDAPTRPSGSNDGVPVLYLDAVPGRIRCE